MLAQSCNPNPTRKDDSYASSLYYVCMHVDGILFLPVDSALSAAFVAE